jgi:hypothetical protein
MTFTYSTDPSTTPKDAVRFYLHDIDITDPLYTDEEIAFAISDWGPNVFDVCRVLAETLIAKFTRLADSSSKTVGDISVSKSYNDKAGQYEKLAASFVARRLRKNRPRIGVNADSLKATSDRTVETFHTDFHLGQMDNPKNVSETNTGY